MKSRISFALLLLLGLARCATAPAAPEVDPSRLNRYLIDPRSGQSSPLSPFAERSFAKGWRAYQAGRLQEAEGHLNAILEREPQQARAELALAAVAIARGDLDRAEQWIDQAESHDPDWATPHIYRAEAALARGDRRRARSLYQAALRENTPASVTQRAEELSRQLFDQLFSEANSATEVETAIRILREALEVNEESDAARRLLGRRLVEARRFEEARREVDRLLLAGRDDEEIQSMLGEIEAGTGRYEEAIARYERLVRRSPDPAYRRRLDQIKGEWIETNMPQHQRRALESSAVTREDLAVLIYWTIPAVRFARNLSEPPIAVDIAEVIGRDELIRAMAFRFFTVDPLTRRVEPYRLVTAANALRILSRIMMLRGTPGCAGQAAQEANELMRAARVLESCGVSVRNLIADPDAPVSGRVAARALSDIAALMKSGEQRQAGQ